MSNKLINSGKTEVKKCEGDQESWGWGVFATQKINRGEIIFESSFILFPHYTALGKNLYDMLKQTGFLNPKEEYVENLRQNLGHRDPTAFYFKWCPKVPLNGDQMWATVIPLGDCCLVNSSNSSPNCHWEIRPDRFIFFADQDIEIGIQVQSHYGYMVSEDGRIWTSPQVFNLAIDKDKEENRYKVKAIRFADAGAMEASKSNPSYQKLFQILQSSKNGFVLTRISGATPDGVERAFQEFNDSLPMSFLYQKLLEFNQSPLPLIKINLKYTNKDTNQEVSDEVVFRK